ncbi:histone acetyltransferase HPA2 and related acetyltransferase [Aquitalea magnusonii]|uniref:Histone acetyltransferase HPA2 and related acetyltransferase n=1 Tax=Aquitalea magnusonii TaxID=332411 RepID=A0A3G9GTI0_9NEIS|nr:GNAT family N-acetyltransferase [Aquitalea magnusonii]BBF87557.1 histone acetyltransferase HPA2 and related acetyltransferase [Aquitalea magnusonii]
MQIRPAVAADVAALQQLILREGPNDWNYLPPDAVAETLQQLAAGRVQGLLAEQQGKLVGIMLFACADPYPQYRPADIAPPQAAFLIEAVVSRACAGQGLGSRLLLAVCAALRTQGYGWLCADRHQQNAGSAGMMRKAGFAELGSYLDTERRWSGSRQTSVCGRRL